VYEAINDWIAENLLLGNGTVSEEGLRDVLLKLTIALSNAEASFRDAGYDLTPEQMQSARDAFETAEKELNNLSDALKIYGKELYGNDDWLLAYMSEITINTPDGDVTTSILDIGALQDHATKSRNELDGLIAKLADLLQLLTETSDEAERTKINADITLAKNQIDNWEGKTVAEYTELISLCTKIDESGTKFEAEATEWVKIADHVIEIQALEAAIKVVNGSKGKSVAQVHSSVFLLPESSSNLIILFVRNVIKSKSLLLHVELPSAVEA